jgi:hypothetical protein
MPLRTRVKRKLVARPDIPDFRDLPFRPMVSVAPQPTLFPNFQLPVRNQGDTNACTGFALSLVVEHLLQRSGREKSPSISPHMLYSMARRYDEFPGSVADDGSSLRGALKGWFRHGACSDMLWTTGTTVTPAATNKIGEDWWLDAVRRPLGAYYRIDTKSIPDMHSALNEVGILYASAVCHSGWDAGSKAPKPKSRPKSFKAPIWTIPTLRAGPNDGGHAFAIVGYNDQGFLLQNSWDTNWGSWGYAILSYEDWLQNAMDCWVAQLGVVTTEHRAIAKSPTLRTDVRGKVTIAASEVLRDREISPFIINMGNNGKLSNEGTFRTTEDDVRALVDIHLAEARQRWKLSKKPIDVCIYAHGGLVGEKDAAATAAQWIPLLYNNRIFPIFFMWETDFLSTIENLIADTLIGIPRTTGIGIGERLERWWNRRLEHALAWPGTKIWGEMKQNADAISGNDASGAVLLYEHFTQIATEQPIRLHLVGHSAGSIVHCFMADRLAARGMKFESVNFLAPAVRVDTFDRLMRPLIDSKTVKRYQQFHLSEQAEEDDPTCGPYRRSLLWLVSQSFEGGTETPILGMKRYFDPYSRKLSTAVTQVAPGDTSKSSTHGGFDDDRATQSKVIDFIFRR